ncbi:MAG TPA: hypothetical protein VFS02_24925 [Telluria sp.]|nr:hypothetical protein [Telluria sp.]
MPTLADAARTLALLAPAPVKVSSPASGKVSNGALHGVAVVMSKLPASRLLATCIRIVVVARTDGDVCADTAESALHEMLFSGGALNTRLLGGAGVDVD